uniref:Ion transport domain-containing protein n=1 Tax=Quercus lobata TaxID=97700 RepID=A0A7N2N2K1_QUELO
MATGRSRSVRFQDDLETANCTPPNDSHLLMPTHNINDKQAPDMCLKSTEEDAIGKYSLGRELSNVFSEDYDVVKKIILDPRGPVLNRWNKIFLLACLLSLFVDPLFFYLLVAKEEACIENMESLEVALTIIWSMIDAFYIVQIFVRFRTAYVAPSSRVFGRGDLVIDPSKIASRYLRKGFWLDPVTALPLPQILIWAAIPNLRGSEITPTSIVVRFLIIFQYLLRLYHIYPLTSEIVNANGVMMETAWAGAVYNLMLCMLASHVLGSCWYLLSILRQEECWMKVCSLEQHDCKYWFLYCSDADNPIRAAWFKSSNISSLCDGTSDFF